MIQSIFVSQLSTKKEFDISSNDNNILVYYSFKYHLTFLSHISKGKAHYILVGKSLESVRWGGLESMKTGVQTGKLPDFFRNDWNLSESCRGKYNKPFQKGNDILSIIIMFTK